MSVSNEERLNKLKANLHSHRELIVFISNVLEWQQSFYPAITAGSISAVFIMLWCWEPSVLTVICFIGMFILSMEFALPYLRTHVYAVPTWTVVEERQFDDVCSLLVDVEVWLTASRDYLSNMKTDRPILHLLMMVSILALVAWLGTYLNSSLLGFLLVMAMAMYPGLRKRGILGNMIKMKIPLQSLTTDSDESSKLKSS